MLKHRVADISVIETDAFDQCQDRNFIWTDMAASEAEVTDVAHALGFERPQKRGYASDQQRAIGSAKLFCRRCDRNVPALRGTGDVDITNAAKHIERHVFNERKAEFAS